jgi:Holliday junction resolvase-like predicted endonuclease
MLIAILEMTRAGPVRQELINKSARIPSQVADELLQRMQSDHLIYVHDSFVEADGLQRLEMAVRALKQGADVEKVSNSLQWREFEGMAAIALENNGYIVQRNTRFKNQGRKWEIDVVGVRKPLVVCIDCKHWHHRLCESTTRKIVGEQIARVRALIRALPNPVTRINRESLDEYKFVPVIVSFIVENCKFSEGVPIVPILQLQDFLKYLPTSVGSMIYIDTNNANVRPGRQKKLVD